MTEHWNRIRRRWWAIPLVLAIALAVAVPLLLSRDASYTAKVALSTYSQNRAPEQDAVLIQSYVDFFNTGADKEQLRTTAKAPASVSFVATPVATGPIMFIAASGTDEAQVQTAAVAMADAFRDGINDGVQRTRENSIEALRKPFLDRIAKKDYILEAERVELSRQIGEINSDTSGRLQELDNAVTVAAEPADVTSVLAIVVVVALLVGAGLAWLLGGRSPRFRGPAQVADALGVRAFDVTSKSPDGRRLQLRHVVNAMAFDDLPSPTVVVVSSVAVGRRTGAVADELARIRAAQGAEVVHVHTTRRSSGTAVGVVDLLRSPEYVTLDMALSNWEHTGTAPGGVAVLGPGRTDIDPHDVMTRENIGDLLGQLRKRFSFVVIDCPPILSSAEVVLMCSAADRTVLVIEDAATSPDQAAEAMRLLTESHADVFGAVVVAAAPRPPITHSMGRHTARRA